MASVIGLIRRLYKVVYPPQVPKLSSDSSALKPLKFGILGAANIGPPALIIPAKSHPEVVVYAVAARSLDKAQAYAKKWGIEKAYQGYQALLDDPEVEVVYNALPNALHYEWTMKALEAGKHVLNEKPSADTAEETAAMFDFAEKKGLILLDAYHYRFHPALKRAKAILDSGELGEIKNITVNMMIPGGLIKPDDIRYDFALGGGALMDMGCYAINCLCYLTSSTPLSVSSASYRPFIPPSPPSSTSHTSQVDQRMEATFVLPSSRTAHINIDFALPKIWGIVPSFPDTGFTVECERGKLEMFNHVLPTLYHSIRVCPRGMHARVEKVYKPIPEVGVGLESGGVEGGQSGDGVQGGDGAQGRKQRGKGEEWWLTYRYQLEALVDRIRGREVETWLGKEDSVRTMEWIERVYEKAGLESRPQSEYFKAKAAAGGL